MNEFPGSSDDERMRQLLDDAVSDVEPRASLDSIRARTAVTPFRARRPWILGAGAAVVATAATVVAVAVMGGSPGTTGAQDPGFAATESPTPSGEPSETTEEPSTEPSPSEEPSTEPSPSVDVEGRTTTVPVYYVGETSRGPRLYREFHLVVGTSKDASRIALAAAIAGTPDDPDYRTDWPRGAWWVASVGEVGGVITVDFGGGTADLHQRPAGMTKQEASLAIEQLIYTVQGTLQSRDPVQLLLNGSRSDMVLGVPTSEPLAQGEASDVLAQVWIISPAEGAQLTSGFEVNGLASAFEANVQWELMQGDTVVKSSFTTAEECCTMSPYSFKVNAPPGDYTLVVHDSDPSDGEGFAPWQDTKNITVTE